MRKFVLIFVALLLALGTLPVAASPVESMTGLAQYFPTTTSIFYAVRTDSDYIAQLDSLAAQLDAGTGGMLAGMNVSAALNMLAQQINPEGTFQSELGWVGDAVALGFTSPEFALPENQNATERFVRFAVALRDPRAAELFMDNVMPQQGIKEEVQGGIIYRAAQGSIDTPVFFLNNAVMIIIVDAGDPMRAVPAAEQSLADLPEFQTTIAALPLDEYNMLMYVDPAFMVPLLNEEDLAMFATEIDAGAVIEAIGPQALGATILDGRSLVLDMTSLVRDRAALEMVAGGDASMVSAPIDLSFAGSVPANTSLLIQDNGIGPAALGALAHLEMLAKDAREQLDAGTLPEGQADLVQMGTGLLLVRNGFRGLSGLSLDEAFGWMSGNFLLFGDLTAGTSADLPVIPNLGIAVENSDGAAASALFNALPRIFTELGVDAVDENGALVVSTLNDLTQNPALDLLFALNDQAFVVGTRPAVEGFAAGGGLADTPAYQLSSSYVLPGSQLLAWIHVTPLADVVGSIAEMSGDPDAAQLAMVLPLLESITLTAAYSEDGSGAVRGVITLAAQ